MTRRFAATSRKAGERPISYQRKALALLLNRFVASPWAVSCTSFVVTALLIRSNALSVF